MTILLLNILLALAWVLFTGEVEWINFVEGLVVGYVVLWISSSALGSTAYFKKIPRVIRFFFYFLWEMIRANLKVTWDILTPKDHMQPGIVAVQMSAQTNLEIALLANLITLTPGTLSLEVSDDKKVLYVHGLYIDDPEAFRREIKDGLEKKLLEILR